MKRPLGVAPFRRSQSGFILLLMIGAMGLGSIYMMMRAFNDAAAFSKSRAQKNLLVLEEAKAAVLMHVESNVATESHPGKLPCPEDTTKIGTVNEGSAQNYCSLPTVGRLPWKTLGYSKAPLDLDGEQLWYAVSPGFNRASGATLIINSNTPAGLTVDGSSARAVALIFSPGPVLNGQSRSTVSSATPPAAIHYLDGENATPDINFATHGTAGNITTEFNDQVVIISHHDLFRVVEPAVARRLNDTMASTVLGINPLTSIYASTTWGASSAAPVFPYPAPFSNPDSSTYQGSSGTTQGLLPLTFSTSSSDATAYCNAAVDGARCDPTFVKWASFQSITKQSGGMTLYATPSPSCTVTNAELSCTVYTSTSSTLTVAVVATASNVAMALRQLDADAPSLSSFSNGSRTVSAIINLDGSAQMTFTGRVADSGTLSAVNTCPDAPSPRRCQIRTFAIPIRIFSDHPIVNSLDTEHGWFTSNEWHKLTHYAISPGFSAAGARSCTGSTCLTITNLSTSPSNNKRALLILAGHSIGAQIRPSGTLSDYLESDNLSPVDTTFVTLKPSMQFNDRVIVVDSN
jgi:hypothetical protein